MEVDSPCAISSRSNIVGRVTLGGQSALDFRVSSLSPCIYVTWLNFVQRELCHFQQLTVRRVTGDGSSIWKADIRKGFQNIDEITCFSCAKSSPRIYEQGWMCLWSTCEFHFQLSGIDATTERLTYTEAFLGARPNPKTKKPAVRIPAPVLEAKNGIVTTSLFYHGWHCRRCGRLSCR